MTPHSLIASARRLAGAWVLAGLVACSASGTAAAPAPLPTLTQPVHDFANVIDAQSAAQLDHYIRTLQAATGDVVIVVTTRTYQPDYGDIRDYAVKLFENHGRGIGDKDKDNGLLVVLAVDDRRLWIEVGYGLEGAITDGFAGETSRLYMAPEFKQGRYGAGLLAGVSRLISRIADERNVTVGDLPRLARERRTQPQQGFPFGFLLTAFVLLLLISWLSSRGRGGRPRGPGSTLGRRGGTHWGPAIGGSSWSGWSGGGSFGGGSFGGGFGGFGGGGSGGGGGGSSW